MKGFISFIKYLRSGNVALITIAITVAIAGGAMMFLLSEFSSVLAQDHGSSVQATGTTTGTTEGGKSGLAVGLGLMAAALSTGLAAVGAGIAVAAVGSAAMGAITEKPEIMGRSLIFVGLAEGIAIYGLIMSILILGKI
jgi:V/A-type H+/Na+-transporting ATPase subunit K